MTNYALRFGTTFDGEEGVKIIAVGVGPAVRRENLEQLASFPTNSTVLIERDVTRINNGELRSKLVDLVCNSEYISSILHPMAVTNARIH